MKVVLRQEVPKLGEVGDVVTVTGGFARNFLIPRGLAVPATKGSIKQSDDWRQSRGAREAKGVRQARDLKQKIEAQPLSVAAQAGPDGRLFGSITAAQIAEALKERLDTDIDRHGIELSEPIRHLGFHSVQIKLHGEVSADVTLEVVEAAEKPPE
jgi:large subunit ribosomal protein L9